MPKINAAPDVDLGSDNMYTKGEQVQAQDLKGRQDLNGLVGEIVERQGDRWVVHFKQPGKGTVSLKPINLKKVQANSPKLKPTPAPVMPKVQPEKKQSLHAFFAAYGDDSD